MKDAGSVKTHGLDANWHAVNATWRLTDPGVQKPLAAAVKCMKAGNRIILDLEEGSYIENRSTGKKTPLYEQDGVMKFKLWIRRGQHPLEALEAAVEEEQAKTVNDWQIPALRHTIFKRQVRLRP